MRGVIKAFVAIYLIALAAFCVYLSESPIDDAREQCPKLSDARFNELVRIIRDDRINCIDYETVIDRVPVMAEGFGCEVCIAAVVDAVYEDEKRDSGLSPTYSAGTP